MKGEERIAHETESTEVPAAPITTTEVISLLMDW